jgi:glucokinase
MLGRGVLALVNCLDPDVFVLAGGMALLGDPLLGPVRDRVRTATFQRVASHVRVEAARLGMYSGCFGAGWLAISGVGALPSMRPMG